MKRIAKAMKDIQSSEIKSAKQEKPFDHRSYFGHDFSSLNDIQAIFDANGLDVSVSEARSGLVTFARHFRILMHIFGWKTTSIHTPAQISVLTLVPPNPRVLKTGTKTGTKNRY
jgi:hypothetical protein